MRRVNEEFEGKKYKLGEVKFSKSLPTDPFIQKVAGIIAGARSVPVTQVFTEIEKEVDERKKLTVKAPTLYHTMVDNIYESELFTMFEKLTIPVEGSPRFNMITLRKLTNYIRGEHSRFFPLRNFIEKRPHANPAYYLTDDPNDPDAAKSPWRAVKTAAATPQGQFIFNVPFCQKLLDWAHLKELKPKHRKYQLHGGPFPNEWAYIEFIIMHEYLHYSEADFYYQNIIPDANPKIINYVGDFRSNYLLVKSGYEQLPIGLFNDLVNYDRQTAYKEMYDIVLKEMENSSEGGGEGGEIDLPINVGDEVRQPNGKKGRVTAVHPDGSADVEDIE